jgi:endoglucanase
MKKLLSLTLFSSVASLCGCAVETSDEVTTMTQAMLSSDGPGHHGAGKKSSRCGPGDSGEILGPHTDLYVPPPNEGSVAQFFDLLLDGDLEGARSIYQLVRNPQAVWLERGTPAEVKNQAKAVVKLAERKGQVPVLVAYNLPFRDCAQYSAGGATTPKAYKKWIDGVAKGIGDKAAVVILEPDGLGIIPHYTNINGETEWCQPEEANPANAAKQRFSMLNYAVDALKALPRVAVYLDGTHSAWLGVGDIADRLVKGGVERADGFYLNASNYQFTANLTQYGTWISKCIAGGDFAGCANQYWNGGPDGTKIADLVGAWTGGALSNYGVWSDDSDLPELNTSGINARFSAEPTTHFVIDTSRNGQGPWTMDGAPGDIQDWCNPPDRGLGARPTTNTGNELVDAHLWIKIPGESDGECHRWVEGGPDPVRGYVNPGAGQWFDEQVLELIEFAEPAL